MRRIRLGILQTNHDKTVEVGDAFPDDAHRFRDMFDAQEDRFTYRVYMTIGGELPKTLEEQDAFMITGSPLSVLDRHVFSDDLTSFIRQCDAAKKPLMGACFGHQAIALALGGKVERSSQGYNVGIENTRFCARRSYMAPDVTELPMYMFHEDAVTALPDGCDLLGSSDKCEIASFAKDDHILTTQSHPEFSVEFMSAVLRYTEDKIPTEARQSAWDSLQKEARGNVFGLWSTNLFKTGLTNAR